MSDEIQAQQLKSQPEIAVTDQSVDALGSRSPSRAGAQAPLGTSYPSRSDTDLASAPDHARIKRKYQRRKPRETDLRCKTMASSIHPVDYEQGRTAFNRSWEIGLGLDTAVTLRPAVFRTMTPEAREQEIRLFLKRIRSFYADNEDMPALAYLLTREAEFNDKDGASEHAHLLIHTGSPEAKRKLKSYLRRRYTAIEAKVKSASPKRVRLANGTFGDASTYSLKAVAAPYAATYEVPHRFSGPVYGARVFWSGNINPVQPRIRVPRATSKNRADQRSKSAPSAV